MRVSSIKKFNACTLLIKFLTFIELDDMATISAVLYCNQNHPQMKQEFPNWTDRCKQILKKWRALSSDKKQPYLQRARENRSTVRTKKAQQVISFIVHGIMSCRLC